MLCLLTYSHFHGRTGASYLMQIVSNVAMGPRMAVGVVQVDSGVVEDVLQRPGATSIGHVMVRKLKTGEHVVSVGHVAWANSITQSWDTNSSAKYII